jgi:hypothetical protein
VGVRPRRGTGCVVPPTEQVRRLSCRAGRPRSGRRPGVKLADRDAAAEPQPDRWQR